MRLLIFLTFCVAQASFAQVNVYDQLLNEVKKESVFKQTTSSAYCPEYIKPKRMNPQKEKEYVRLVPYDMDGKNSGSFTHEGNRITYKKGLTKGKRHTFNRELFFNLGILYRWQAQTEERGVLTYEYSAKAFSLVLKGTSYFKLVYNSNKQSISYEFKSWGSDDVYCDFQKINH